MRTNLRTTLSAIALAALAATSTGVPAQAYPYAAEAAGAPATSSSSTYDSDGDGIPDSWETQGYDANNDGRVDLDFPAWGADPMKKDIFVEADYMQGLMASQSELDAIVDTFSRYPVPNPDGSQGINLHIDAGRIYAGTQYDLGGGEQIPNVTLQNEVTVGQLRDRYSNPARNGIFHYMVFGDYYTDAPGSSGIAQINGLNFAVTLGPTHWGDVSSETTIGTFIHELGHNLGLRHGGNDEVNFKPNYFSIMNYRYQIKGVPRTDGSRYFGYSDREYAPLNEQEIFEEDGLGQAARGWLYDYRPNARADQPIDFNDSGRIDYEPVRADVNNDGYLDTYLSAPNDLRLIRFQARARGGYYGYGAGVLRTEVADDELTVHEAHAHDLLD